MEISRRLLAYLKVQGRRGGQKRMAEMTKKERSEFGRHAVKVRWAKKRNEKPLDPAEEDSITTVVESAEPAAPATPEATSEQLQADNVTATPSPDSKVEPWMPAFLTRERKERIDRRDRLLRSSRQNTVQHGTFFY